MIDPDPLDRRTRLPSALRLLLADYPRAIWESHAHFDGLTRFWLERHLMFRELLDRLRDEAEAALDARTDGQTYQRQTRRLAGFFLDQLHGHHMIEDHHYFPQLSGLEPALARGFAMLDADHHALDARIRALSALTEALLRAPPDALTDEAGRLHAGLDRFAILLDRHLTDEEELVVPVILKHAPRIGG